MKILINIYEARCKKGGRCRLWKKDISNKLWLDWSASKYKSFKLCPRQFCLTYILGIKTSKNIWQAIGEIEHYIYKIGIRKNFKSVYSFVKTGLLYATNYKKRGYKEEILLRNDEEKKIKKNKIGFMLCKFKAFYFENLDYHEIKKGKKVIKPSIYPIPETEKRIVFIHKGVKIVSVIDRIDYVNGGYIVIDYKSTADYPAVYNRDPQYTIYDIACRKKFEKEPLEICFSVYVHPEKSKSEICRENYAIVMQSIDESELSKKEQEFRKLVDNLPAGKFIRIPIKAKTEEERTKILEKIYDASIQLKNIFNDKREINFKNLPVIDKIFFPREGRHCHYCNYEQKCQKIEEEGIKSLFSLFIN